MPDDPARADGASRPSRNAAPDDAAREASRAARVPTQALRALFAVFIVLHHGLDHWPGGEVLQEIGFARFGVFTFFVITAFTFEMARATNYRDLSPGRVLLRRLARVLPMYWLFTLVLAGLMMRRGTPVPIVDELLPSLLLWPHWSTIHPAEVWPLLVPAWSLSFVVGYYLFASALLAVPHREAVTVGVLLMLVALGFAFEFESAWASTLTSPMLLSFVLGLVAARRFIAGGLRHAAWAGLIPVGLAFVVLSHWADQPIFKAVGGALCFAGVLPLGRAAWLRRARPVMAVGAASYSIYLVHTLVQGSMATRFGDLMLRSSMPGGIFVLLFVAVPIAVGIVVHHVLERPLGARISTWLRLPAASVVATNRRPAAVRSGGA